MRKLPLSILALVTLPAVAAAAPPKPCSDPLRAWEAATRAAVAAKSKTLPPLMLDGSHLDCMKDDVLVLNGETLGNLPDDPMGTPPQPLADCRPDAKDMAKKDPANCTVDYARAVKRALDLIGPVPETQWDQIVVFAQMMSPSESPPAPLFFRQGRYLASDGTLFQSGVNEVANIGLPPPDETTKRVPGRPFVGYIAAGGTNQAAKFIEASMDAPAPKLAREDPAGPLAVSLACADISPGVCYLGYHNFFDALAQATGMMFGPYLKGPTDGLRDSEMHPLAPLSVPPWSKAKLGSVDLAFKAHPAGAQYFSLEARIWNSFLDLQGSVMAGSTFRDNGNGTFETTGPPPYYGINVPFAAGWKPGQVIAGTRRLRFQPLDLYAMGLLPIEQLPPTIRSFVTQPPKQVVKPALGNSPKFDPTVGPLMGLRPGVALRPVVKMGLSEVAPEDITLQTNDILAANGGLRVPAFPDAPHAIKQLWVVVSKPQALIEQDGKDDAEKQAKRALGLQHLDAVVNWRHEFAAYYYMLTQYRGRVITSYDGVEDDAYFEFGQPTDDMMAFAPDDGVTMLNPGSERINPNTPDLKSVMRLRAVPGNGGGVTYTGKPFALRISGSQTSSRVPVNSVAVRMRIPPGVPAGGAATVTLLGGPGDVAVRLPGSCNGRPGCKESASLVNDGKWHTYSANLGANAGFVDKAFTGFKLGFALADNKPYDSGDDAEGIEVEYIRFGYLPSALDGDQVRVACSECGKLPDGNAQKKCTTICQSRPGGDRVLVDQSDGWLDSEDNCPGVYNPSQEDGDNDGTGDACEDLDGDGAVNAWDNCPSSSNSRQRDQDGDGIGDVCDDSSGGGCFLKPSSLGGAGAAAPGALVAVLIAFGLVIARRRRAK